MLPSVDLSFLWPALQKGGEMEVGKVGLLCSALPSMEFIAFIDLFTGLWPFQNVIPMGKHTRRCLQCSTKGKTVRSLSWL